MTPRSIGTVLVTGGASGLGEATVQCISAAGGRPIVLDRKPPNLDVAYEILDLGDRQSTTRVVNDVVRSVGGVDGVVTAAGIDRCGPLADVELEEWEQVIAVNLLGTVAVIRAALPSLRERSGRIVTVASTLGWRALPDATAYCASKFGVVGFTRALSAELAGEIGVTLLLPGGMRTNFFDDRPDKYKPGPDAKLADPISIAEAVVFALSRPPGSVVRELMVTGETETSWP
jgi:NAD(P)-dependent dehydrogenase (short-subunit alcohol dehydrogenase family)